VAEIHVVADGFAAGARRAVDAGADGVEVHGANGYLLWQFITPKTNLRIDEFGGSVENNVRFARLVGDKIRAAIGPDKLITLRLLQDGVDDFVGAWPGGVRYAEAVDKALKGSTYDALHWSSFDYLDNRDPNDPTPMATVLRRASGLPVITNGGIADGQKVRGAAQGRMRGQIRHRTKPPPGDLASLKPCYQRGHCQGAHTRGDLMSRAARFATRPGLVAKRGPVARAGFCSTVWQKRSHSALLWTATMTMPSVQDIGP
jgi:hypothetical protein